MTLNENDYLTYQLYTASKTPRIKKARIKSWILTTMTLSCLTYFFFRNNNNFLGIYFLIASGLSLTLYPFYSRWRYKRHYLKHTQDTYKDQIGEECIIEINEDTIVTKSKSGEVKVNTTEVEEINEISEFYFIKTKAGISLIISKVNADDPEKIKSEIKSLIDKRGIKHNVELDWKWR